MKILLSYVLVVSVGLVTPYSCVKAQGERIDYVAALMPLPLENDDFDMANGLTKSVIQINSGFWFKKKQSIIYYESISDRIEALIEHKAFEGFRRFLKVAATLNQDSLSHPSNQNIKSHYYPLDKRQVKALIESKQDFLIHAQALSKLPFREQEIGKYHHQLMDGTSQCLGNFKGGGTAGVPPIPLLLFKFF